MAKHHLDQEKAAAVAESELQALEDYTNGAVYALAIQRAGQNSDTFTGPIYPQGRGFPTREILDSILGEEECLTQQERQNIAETAWRTPVRTVAWR